MLKLISTVHPTTRGDRGFGSTDSDDTQPDNTIPGGSHTSNPHNTGRSLPDPPEQLYHDNSKVKRATTPPRNNQNLQSPSHLLTNQNQTTKNYNEFQLNSKPPSKHLPIPIHTWDKVPSNAPNIRQMTIEELQKSIGFLNADRLLSTLQKTSQPTIQISNTDREPFLDLGEVATLDKPARNTNPLPLPPHVGHTIHIDIAYGS